MQWKEWKKIERGTSYATLNLRQWGVGIAIPPVSIYWNFGGKWLQKKHAETIKLQLEMGINPGLMIYQPFK